MSRHASTALAAFIQAAEHGSFAAAGRMLGISAAAVGQNVKRLEDTWGVKLINRTTRQMSLTPDGTMLYQRVRGPLRELDEIDHLFDESRGVVSGQLRITATRRFAGQVIVPLIAAFRERHPAIEIELDASDTIRDFVNDPVDVAFRIGQPSDSTMIARHLTDLTMLTMASPDYLARKGTPSHPQDLEDHDCLQFRFAQSGEIWPWPFEVDGVVQHMRPDGALTFNDGEVLIEAGLAGLGLFQIDSCFVTEHIEAGRLVPVMEAYATNVFSLYLCYPSKENLPLRVRAFIDFVLEHRIGDCFEGPAAQRSLAAE